MRRNQTSAGPWPQCAVFALLAALVVVLFAASLLIGPAAIGLSDSLRALLSGQGDEMVVLVMQEVRLPRALLGAMVGAGLGATGAVMQGWLRNPLAEPASLGTSASAALGAVLVLQTGLAALWPLALPLAGLTGAGLSVLLVLGVAGASTQAAGAQGSRGATLTLILAGMGISALAAAGTALVLNLSPNPFAASEIVFWLMGSLADRSMGHVWLALGPMVAGALLMACAARGLDALSLGEDVAATLGVNLPRLRLLILGGVALTVGAATSVAGAIGFVGLVVPHLLRRAVGARPSRLVPAAALGGAAVLLGADIAVRLLAPDRDLKLGVLTALVGAPFFLRMILATRKEIS